MSKLRDLLNKAGNKQKGNAASVKYTLMYEDYSDADLLYTLKELVWLIEKGIDRHKRNQLVLKCLDLAFHKAPRARGAFHPSEISTEAIICKRKMYFQYADAPVDKLYMREAETNNQLQRLFDLGTFVHLYMQNGLWRAGILEDFEVPISAPEFGIEGAADGIVNLLVEGVMQRLGLEIKTINSFLFKGLVRPKDEHIKQASIYFSFLGLKKVLFIYYNKDTSEFKEFVADVDEAYVDGFKQLAKEIITMHFSNVRSTRSTDVEHHTLPPRNCCAKRTDKRAMGCPFADTCFKLK
jgi:hypothetical protein